MYVKNYFADVENDDGSEVSYPTDIMAAVFQFWLKTSLGSSHTDEL